MTKIERELIKAAKNDKEGMAVYSDWLQEQGRIIEAAKLRFRAGLSKLGFRIYEKGSNKIISREYSTLSSAMAFFNRHDGQNYIQMFEYRKSKVGDIFPDKK